MGYPAAQFAPGSPSIRGFLVGIDPDRAADAVSILDEVEGDNHNIPSTRDRPFQWVPQSATNGLDQPTVHSLG